MMLCLKTFILLSLLACSVWCSNEDDEDQASRRASGRLAEKRKRVNDDGKMKRPMNAKIAKTAVRTQPTNTSFIMQVKRAAIEGAQGGQQRSAQSQNHERKARREAGR